MSFNTEQKASLSRLKALFSLIYDEAAKSPEFLSSIEKVLLSNDAIVKVQKKPSSKKNEPVLNPVDILQQFGKEELEKQLKELKKDDIVNIARLHGIKSLKDARETDYQELIVVILDYSEKKLSQGSSFLKDGG